MGYNWLPCVCHRLHLLVNDSLARIAPILKRHRNMVRHFKKSGKTKRKLIGAQLDNGVKKPIGLIAGSPTRWTGTYDMLARYML